MLSKERLITYSIIFIILSTLIYFVFLGDEEYVVDYNVKINALEAKVDSLHSVNDHLVFKIDTLNQEINKNQEVEDQAILSLKTTKGNEISTEDLLELDLFFPKKKMRGFLLTIYNLWEYWIIKKHMERSRVI